MLLKTKDGTFRNAQDEPQCEANFESKMRRLIPKSSRLMAVRESHCATSRSSPNQRCAIAFGGGQAYGVGWTGRKDTFDWMWC